MVQSEQVKLIQAAYNSYVIGHGEKAFSPEEDLATAIVENAIYDYKYGVEELTKMFGRRKIKSIVYGISNICANPRIKKYYKSTAANDDEKVGPSKVIIMLALLRELDRQTGEKIRGNLNLNTALYNMFDAEMFFRENDWCTNLCGMSGIDILRMIRESEGITSQKKQVA